MCSHLILNITANVRKLKDRAVNARAEFLTIFYQWDRILVDALQSLIGLSAHAALTITVSDPC
jgi:hypothetical protein